MKLARVRKALNLYGLVAEMQAGSARFSLLT